MAARTRLGFSAYFKRDNARSRLFVQGKGTIRLDHADFKAHGGEGAIFVKGSTAYKIYTDPQKTISPAKIQELSVLTESNIIRPLDLLLDSKSQPIGYSMRYVGKSFALCQLFPRAFRQRNNLTPELTLQLVRKLRDGVKHVHSKGILIVDLNELNFLVAEDFSDVYFIDVDSYQTPSFPATVLMESVRDRQAQTFTTGSDWFSFAVVSFQMFVGIHPFKGTYAPLQNLSDKVTKLDERMRANISVLHPGVSVPPSCLPFSVIPPDYLDWYQAVFETGQRIPPPDSLILKPGGSLAPSPLGIRSNFGTSIFEVAELREFDSEIISHDRLITVTKKSIYFGGRQYAKPVSDVRVAITPRQQHLVVAFMDGLKPHFYDLTANMELGPAIEGEAIMLNDGRLYVKQNESILAIEFLELARQTLLTVRVVANVMMKSTLLFDGLAIQNLLGASYAAIPTALDVCHQVRLAELDSYQVIDARLLRNVLVVVATKSGIYDKLIFRFADDFNSYDVRVVANTSAIDIDFTVLDSGIVLNMTDEGDVEVFSRDQNSAQIKVINDPAIRGDLTLFHVGSQALIARENKLYKIRMR
jgi:serine/threonine protein kinase